MERRLYTSKLDPYIIDRERKYSRRQVSAKQHHSFLGGIMAWSDFVGISPLRRPPDVQSGASRSSPLDS